MEKLTDITTYPVANVLDTLLEDKTTKKNIIWATDTYAELGVGFSDKAPMDKELLLKHGEIICPRIQKPRETQNERTRKKAEVFTPAWLCNQMNNYLDEDWFGRRDVFNFENADRTWTVNEEKIEFPKRKKWTDYVDSKRLEITCGEAPYLVSRYDVSTGELIVLPKRRVGILDRKLRVVNENTDAYDGWLKQTRRAFEACYGYEYQGDNVLCARINLLLTFVDYYEERWRKRPEDGTLSEIAEIIARNIWQMDGLKDTVPLGKPFEENRQFTMFDTEDEDEQKAVPCEIYDWEKEEVKKFLSLKGTGIQQMKTKLFDYVIGNPPYQDETTGDQKNFAPPVYHLFMDESYRIADKVELIHPARFLFNAGSTPKFWNRKMLNDGHFKVLHYEQDSGKVFANTDIKGGGGNAYLS